MEVDKIFYKNLFKNLFSDPCSVEFWDGDVEKFGKDDPKFQIILREPIPKMEIISDPSLAFGEAYMHGRIEIKGNIREVIDSMFKNKDSFLYQTPAYLKLVKFISNVIKKARKIPSFIMILGMIFTVYGLMKC